MKDILKKPWVLVSHQFDGLWIETDVLKEKSSRVLTIAQERDYTHEESRIAEHMVELHNKEIKK